MVVMFVVTVAIVEGAGGASDYEKLDSVDMDQRTTAKVKGERDNSISSYGIRCRRRFASAPF